MNTQQPRRVKSLIIATTIAIGSMAIAISLFTTNVFASVSDNLFGYMWSSNVGWMKVNNCDSPTDPCNLPNYGVNVGTTSDANGYRNITGYAWGSNIGWISFNSNSVTGCPASIPASSTCQARVNWEDPEKPVSGWARACSGARYPISCSGKFTESEISYATNPANSGTALADQYNTWFARTGGWDGYISLGDTNTSDSVEYGLNMTDTDVLGFAWGSDVLGWISFDNVYIASGEDMCPNIAGLQNAIPDGYVLDTDGNCIVNPGECPTGDCPTTPPEPCEKGDPCWCAENPGEEICNTPGGPSCLPEQVPINGICFDCPAPNVVIIKAGTPQCVDRCLAGQVANSSRVCIKPGIKEF